MHIPPAPGVKEALLPALRQACAALSALHGTAIGTIILGQDPCHDGTPKPWARVFLPQPDSHHDALAQQHRLRTQRLAEHLQAAGRAVRAASLPLFGPAFLPSDVIYDHTRHGHHGHIQAAIMGRRFTFPHHTPQAAEDIAHILAQVHTIIIAGRDPMTLPPPGPLWLEQPDPLNSAIIHMPGTTKDEQRANYDAIQRLLAPGEQGTPA